MPIRRAVVASLLALLPAALGACADAENKDDPSPSGESSEDELKKRVSGAGASGKLVAPKVSWYVQGVQASDMKQNGALVQFGNTLDLPPGKIALTIEPHRADGPRFNLGFVEVVAGGTTTLPAPSGIRVRRDRTLTWEGVGIVGGAWLAGASPMSIKNVMVTSETGRRLDGVDPLDRADEFLVPAGTYALGYDGLTREILVAPGQHIDVTFPSTTLEIVTDPIDPAFPNPAKFNGEFYVSDATDQNVLRVRDFGKRIVRAGAVARLHNAWGLEVTATAKVGEAVVAHLNRLEVEPLQITTNGVATGVPATCNLSVKKNDKWVAAGAGFSCDHVGFDVPDGSYRVSYRAIGSTYVDAREISFP